MTAEATFRQAVALHEAGDLDAAEALYRQLSGYRPQSVYANLGHILRTTGRLAEAEAAYRRSLAAEPRAGVEYSLGMTLLQQGRYAEGWRMYEGRRSGAISLPPAPPLPEWTGGDPAGRRLLIVAEQGLGDQILLSRFLPLLKARGAHVAYAAGRPLVRLCAPLADEVFNPHGWDGVEADAWAYMATLAAHLAVGPADAPAPYLSAPPVREASGRFAPVGLMLQGDPRNGNNARRIPPPAVEAQIRGLLPFVDLAPQATGARDFHDTARIVAGLELVVTIDTSVAHLAGAMGKPCLVLMPRPAIDWWANWSDDRTPWYPSIRTIRQPQPGDWTSVFAALREALAARGFLS